MDKQLIIEMFRNNVKGRSPDVSGRNERHDGRYGHWLEQQFEITANRSNEADILGYELKNQTATKTSFGDWSANYYIFNSNNYPSVFNANTKIENRNIFLTIFGKKNMDVEGRYSWSGEPVPNIHRFNRFGQKLIIEPNNKDILAIYSYSEDQREDKNIIVPEILKQEELILARWYGNSMPENRPDGVAGKSLRSKVEDKFNQKGWFVCKMNNEGLYDKICFGAPITYDTWVEMVEGGEIFFDSGMYNQNIRPYSQWRINNTAWNNLIIEVYE